MDEFAFKAGISFIFDDWTLRYRDRNTNAPNHIFYKPSKMKLVLMNSMYSE